MNGSELRSRLLERADAAGLQLATPILARIETYFHLLTHWNKRINLTSLKLDPANDECLDRLLVEPLAAAKYMSDSPLSWMDLGSGGGSPAFPLKIARPAAKLTLIEARSRKAAFLREVARELDFPDVHVVSERFEESSMRPEFQATADLVTVRAIRIDAALADAVHRLLRDDGRLLLFLGSDDAISSALAGLTQTLSVALTPQGNSHFGIFKRSVPRGTTSSVTPKHR